MSSSEDTATLHLAAWANLPLRDRIADRFAAIIFAAEQIQSMLDIEGPLEDAQFDVAGTARAVSRLVRSVSRSSVEQCWGLASTIPNWKRFWHDLIET